METIDLKGIRNIIFDLGGVILNLDYNQSRKAFERLGVSDFNTVYSQARQSHLFDRLETGRISPVEFCQELNDLLKLELSQKEVFTAWNAMLLDLPEARLDLIENLGKEYRIFLLSNTNAIHIEAFYKILEKGSGVRRFENLFEKIYYSHQIQLRKPDATVFKYILQENILKNNDTLFVDDSHQHIVGATSCGINTFWLHGQDLDDLFPKKNQAL